MRRHHAVRKTSTTVAAAAKDGPVLRPVWSGTLSFGLVTIPVDLHAAVRPAKTTLRMLSPEGRPLARRWLSARGRPLERSDIARGFELPDGRMVLISDDELDALAPEQSRDIALASFVPAGSIDPLYLERPYVLTPRDGVTKPYQLLAATMEKLQRAGVAYFVMHGKQYLVAIFAQGGVLRADTLRFRDELRSARSLGVRDLEPSPARLRSMTSALKGIAKHGAAVREPPRDEYADKLTKLVEKKRKAHQDVVALPASEPDADEHADVADLLQVLRQSLMASSPDKAGPVQKAKTPAKKAPAKKAKTPARKGAKARA